MIPESTSLQPNRFGTRTAATGKSSTQTAAPGRYSRPAAARAVLLCLLCLGMASPAGAQAVVNVTPSLKASRTGTASQAAQAQGSAWQRAVARAITGIHAGGPGGYSTEDAAHEALHASFQWSETQQRPLANPAGMRPSFCSGAVYGALLQALMYWDAAHRHPVISKKAWQALFPAPCKDGVTPWGYANANGAGFALLIHRLGAGYSFTDYTKACPGDVLKIWWTPVIGGRERGHLVIFVRDLGESIRVWSSHQARNGKPAGFGMRDIPKAVIARALFTRINNPAAFNRAPALPDDEWLTRQLTEGVSWEECVHRCGILP